MYVCTAFVLWSILPAAPLADGLPKTFAWTAYGTTSAGYAASVAVAKALAEEGYRLRVLPAKNDISRLTPLKNKRVQFSAGGVAALQAQEGVLDFGKGRWGPQSIRVVMMAWGHENVALPVTAADANIRKASDLKGKRIAWVVGGPSLNHSMTAWLAYGNLGWKDVVKVRVPGFKQSIQGMIDGNVDAAIASTNTSMLFQLDSSPRGLHFFPAPAAEKENWARFNKVAPWFVPHVATAGVGLSEANTHEGATYGYPVLITYDWLSDDAVYELVRLMHTKYDSYKDAHPTAGGFAMDRQVFKWLVPFHPGAIRYFTEIGLWTEGDEAHNDKLLQRQRLMQATWKKSKGSSGNSQTQYEQWMKTRAAALTAAGFSPIWEK
jgi:TRAP transporter TAXI family solute receptor